MDFAPELAELQNLMSRLRWAVGLRKGFSPGDTIALPELVHPAQMDPGHEDV